MTHVRLFFRTASLVALMACATSIPARAQEEDSEVLTPGGVLPAGAAATYNPGDQLAANLKLLAQNPRNVTALTQAGASALTAGDASAALGFLARADELNPSSPRIKQLLGSALVQLERPEDGLRLFGEATALGGLNREILRDRGLAFDLRGDPRRAQADYAEVLRRGTDDEVSRRYALSLGATGDREQALRLLEPLIRKQDQAAWRARAFILAMTGDLKAAERIVAEVMPPNMAGTLGSFMRKLPALTPAQRALAVNFGTMPADGPQYALASATEALRPITGQAAQNLARAAEPAPVVVASAVSGKREKPSKAERRRPGRDRERGEQVVLALPTRPTSPAPELSQSSNQRPGFSAPALSTPKPSVVPPVAPRPAVPDNRQGVRVNQRVGPVDVTLLPPEVRPVAPAPIAGAPVTAQAAVLATTQVLPSAPKPAQVTPPIQSVPVASVAPPPVSSTLPSASLSTASTSARVGGTVPSPVVTSPRPLFEIPSAKVDPAPQGVATVAATPPTVPPVTSPVVASSSPLAVTQSAVSVATSVPPAPRPAVVTPPPIVVSPAFVTQPSITAPAGPASGPSRAEAGISTLPTSVAPVISAGSVQTASNISNSVDQVVTPLPTASVVREVAQPVPPEAPPVSSSVAAATFAPSTSPSQSAPVANQPVQVAAASAPSTTALPERPRGLQDVIGTLEGEEESSAGKILSDAEFRRARLAAKRKADAEAAEREGKEAAKTKEAEAAKAAAKLKAAEEEEKRQIAKRNPGRVWVQVATGSNRGGLPGTWSKIKEKGGDALKGQSAASVPFKSTNRLLAGPYRSQAEARAAVNKLAAKGIQATIFSSEAGQEVNAVGGR